LRVVVGRRVVGFLDGCESGHGGGSVEKVDGEFEAVETNV
jgi:hypothetical protein